MEVIRGRLFSDQAAAGRFTSRAARSGGSRQRYRILYFPIADAKEITSRIRTNRYLYPDGEVSKTPEWQDIETGGSRTQGGIEEKPRRAARALAERGSRINPSQMRPGKRETGA